MSSTAPPQPQLAPQNDSASATGQGGSKKRNKKKKSAAAKANAAAAASAASTPTETTAPASPTEPDPQEASDRDDGETADKMVNDAPAKDETAPINTDALASPTKATVNGNGHARNGSIANGHAIPLHLKHEATDTDGDKASTAAETPIHDRNDRPSIPNTASEKTTTPDAMTHDDEALRAENERLRRQVEELQKAQETQKEEAEQLHADLEESEAGREQAETQYQNLLGRVEKIRETLGDRLKRDRQELEVAKDRIEELEAQNEALRQDSATATATATAAEAQVKRLQKELDEMEQENEREQTEIRSRAQLSQQNWQREKDELTRQVQQLRMELDSTSGAMSEWEVIAMEERSVRETLTEKVADLEEQLAVTREQHQVAVAERDSQGNAVDSLQRALQEIQEARKHELREMVRESEVKLEEAEKRVQKAESDAEKAVAEARTLKEEVERTSPFEREVKEKNLLIGKLRHETIVLNDHLTKALRYIKKNKPEENVDRQVVTNHLLQFLALDRSDPKKFQVLQVIAGMLQWTEEQKEKAGLARPGTSGSSLRLPSSPFGRTPSTPALNAEFFSEPTPTGGRESLADLWAGFLERSVEEATSESSNPSSRKGSTSGG